MLKFLIQKSFTKLGRWKIVHNIKIINIKIDQANQDNGESLYQFDETKETKEDDFLVPYCM
jgi:hypothetical protein